MIEAANERDWAAFAGAFTPDALLDGWGQHLRSRDEIARWSAGDNNEMPAQVFVRGWFSYGDVATVGMDAPNTEDNGTLTFVFELRGQLVRSLRVSG